MTCDKVAQVICVTGGCGGEGGCWTCDKEAWVICVTSGCRGEGGLKSKDSRLGIMEGSKVVSSAVLEAEENSFSAEIC